MYVYKINDNNSFAQICLISCRCFRIIYFHISFIILLQIIIIEYYNYRIDNVYLLLTCYSIYII